MSYPTTMWIFGHSSKLQEEISCQKNSVGKGSDDPKSVHIVTAIPERIKEDFVTVLHAKIVYFIVFLVTH